MSLLVKDGIKAEGGRSHNGKYQEYVETARVHYTCAREEFLERIRLRDNVLVLYLGGTGLIFGIALGSQGGNPHPEIYFAVPFLGLGTSLLVAQHTQAMSALRRFCSRDLRPFLQKHNAYAPQLESCDSLKGHIKSIIIFRLWANVLIIGLPCTASILATAENALNAFSRGDHHTVFLWLVCVVLTIAAIAVVLNVDRRRVSSDEIHAWDSWIT